VEYIILVQTSFNGDAYLTIASLPNDPKTNAQQHYKTSFTITLQNNITKQHYKTTLQNNITKQHYKTTLQNHIT